MGLHPAERVREYRDRGFWTDDTIDALLRERVARDGDIPALADPLNRAALVDGPVRTLTWPQLDEQVSRLAQVLLDEGVGPGDVVGIQLPNTVEIVVAFLAVVRIGAIVAPFPVQYRAHELTHLSGVAQVRAFLVASRIGQRPAAAELAGMRPHIPSLRWVGVFGAGLDERIDAAGDRGGLAAHLAAWSPDPNDCVTICWTSGTEAAPKGVQRTHYDWLAMSTGTVEGPDLTAGDVLLNPFPMVNMAGINGMFLPWLRVGGLLVQHHPFDLPTFLRQIEQYRATYTCAPPALLTALLHNEALAARADLSSLRVLGSGSTPLAPSLLQGWHDKYGIEIINFYGSNEGIALLGTPKDIPDPAVRAQYFPRYAVRDWSITMSRTTLARIVDPLTGAEITEAGVPGELRIKGPGVFPRVPAGQRRARPVRRGRRPEDGRHPGDRRRRRPVPALCRPVPGPGGAGRDEDLGGGTGGAHRGPPDGGRRRGGGLSGRGPRRARLRRRRAPARQDGEPGRDRRVPARSRHRHVQAARAAGGAGRTAPQPTGQGPQAGTARGAPRFLTGFRGRPGSAGTAAARPASGCGRRSRWA